MLLSWSTAPEALPTIPGYTLVEQLHANEVTAVYRALKTAVTPQEERSVIIKVLQRVYPSFSDLTKFRNQYAIAHNLPIPGIVRPLSLEPWQNGYALVMEDFGGVSLSEYVKAHSLSLIQTLAIGVQMAEILHDLGQYSLIHKDIKPAHILIHPESHQVKLTDFSIASLLPTETQQLQTPNELAKGLEGTLAYLAPEQTGRMNRGVDYRADFYALGVTLYELLTGDRPFQSDDPLALVHAHIAKLPTPPHQKKASIPSVVSAIVLKLMAKNAEDRYQSALGLKHDLEKCLHGLKETEAIEPFELAQQDVCDRFLIPEKLYGREAEVATLLDAFARVAAPKEAAPKEAAPKEKRTETTRNSAEIVLVAGFSGIGKTAIIQEVHKPITRQQGYFIQGKFDQFNSNTPFSAFVSAFRSLMTQLLGETDTALAQWKTNILAAVGEKAQIIIEVIPELETILGPQPPVSQLPGPATQARFNQLFGKFVRVFACHNHPLVIFLDDLQWADAASLTLLTVLTAEAQAESLLVLGAYRNNEVFAAHPLMLTLDALTKQGTPIHQLTLDPLPLTETVHLVADTLHCSATAAEPLAKLIDKKAQGNPFFTTQFLTGLNKEGCIFFDVEKGHWQCDLTQVQQLAATDDVVSFMVSRLQKLPEATQAVLKLAACLGNRFDLNALSVVCQKHPLVLSADLWASLKEGFIIPEGETYQFSQQDLAQGDPLVTFGQTDVSPVNQRNNAINTSYRFLHDRVQQAAYVSIPKDQRPFTHYDIGQRLLTQLSDQNVEPSQCENLFDIVNHLNFGQPLLTLETQQIQLAQLNLIAGQKALASTAYAAAMEYLTTGISLLEDNNLPDIWTHHYDLLFSLYYTLCTAHLNSANYDPLTATLEKALQHITNPTDLAEIYVIQVVQLTCCSDYSAAIQAGLTGLEKLGMEVPLDTLSEATTAEFTAINQRLENRPVQSLLDLPAAVDPTIKAAIKLLIAIDPPTYIIADTELYSFVSLKAASLSVTHGNLPESIKAYANCGLLLGMMKGDYQKGYDFADLAVQLSYKLDSKSQRCKASLLFGAWVHVWAKPIAGAAETNYQGFLAGVESGETQFAAYNLFGNLFNRIFQGENLFAIAEGVQKYGSIANKNKNELLLAALAGAHIFTQKLCQTQTEQAQIEQAQTKQTQTKQASSLSIVDSEQTIAQAEASQAWFSVCLYYILRMHLACLTANFEEGLQYEAAAGKILNAIIGFTTYSDYYYYGSLIVLNHYAESSEPERATAFQKVKEQQQQLKLWSNSCPENFRHKYLLVEAERCRVLGDRLAAMDLYDQAIASAKENGYIQEEAFANELAAKFYLQWGKARFAAGYIQEAYYGYVRWGARAKVEQLEQQYPVALASILHDQSSLSTRTRSTSQQTNLWLDLPAVIQASQAISQEIQLEKLLETLVRIATTNAGAQSGYLLLCANGDAPKRDNLEDTWIVATCARQDQLTTINLPLSDYSGLPRSLIYAVARTRETAVFEDLSAREQFSTDRYVVENKPKSALGIPISRKGQLVGVLYLENNLAVGAFTRDRIELLKLLTSQAAISIENARLYQKTENYSQTLETEVAYKTKALNQKAEDLEAALVTIQKTQAQLIQTEKMSSLGQMVAGIAHEINNPISFIQGNVGHTRSYIEDILDLLALYQQEYPQPGEAIESLRSEMDIDFLVEDITRLLGSMASGSDRIKQIVLSLRNFSRLDESAMKAVDLHSGLESTLLIVQNRLQAVDGNPAIQLVKNYGELPELMCYPSQINQVFLHLINNAVDAIREQPKSAQPPRIQITTGVRKQGKIRIAIANNGSPIPADIQSRIFDPFFTTKSVGSGTGLGLFVSYSTIQEHDGKLSVQSSGSRGTEFEILLPQVSDRR